LIVLIMGVTGAGKTTVGELLAARLQFEFVDADVFHSAENIDKMKHGIPLTDADRQPWLAVIHSATLQWASEKRNVVLACSALKQAYRDTIADGVEIQTVYLQGSYDFIAARLRERHGHYADEKILRGQFDDLEEPSTADAIRVSIEQMPEAIVEEVERQLAAR
jgi:gluconokinase